MLYHSLSPNFISCSSLSIFLYDRQQNDINLDQEEYYALRADSLNHYGMFLLLGDCTVAQRWN